MKMQVERVLIIMLLVVNAGAYAMESKSRALKDIEVICDWFKKMSIEAVIKPYTLYLNDLINEKDLTSDEQQQIDVRIKSLRNGD